MELPQKEEKRTQNLARARTLVRTAISSPKHAQYQRKHTSGRAEQSWCLRYCRVEPGVLCEESRQTRPWIGKPAPPPPRVPNAPYKSGDSADASFRAVFSSLVFFVFLLRDTWWVLLPPLSFHAPRLVRRRNQPFRTRKAERPAADCYR